MECKLFYRVLEAKKCKNNRSKKSKILIFIQSHNYAQRISAHLRAFVITAPNMFCRYQKQISYIITVHSVVEQYTQQRRLTRILSMNWYPACQIWHAITFAYTHGNANNDRIEPANMVACRTPGLMRRWNNWYTPPIESNQIDSS